MRRVIVFNSMSLDGYISDPKGDMSWAHNPAKDAEWSEFVAGNAKGGGELLFGRVTYDLMIRYWPTPLAAEHDSAVAQRMNAMPKVVFSRSMDKASWSNTRLVKGDARAELRTMKRAPGPDMVLLGSGTLVAQLAQDNLIDEFQIVVIPVILGGGKTMFSGVSGKPALRLLSTRAFKNGNVLLCYAPTS